MWNEMLHDFNHIGWLILGEGAIIFILVGIPLIGMLIETLLSRNTIIRQEKLKTKTKNNLIYFDNIKKLKNIKTERA